MLNALGAYGPPGTPPVLPYEKAQETMQALPVRAAVAQRHCAYIEIPGNHVTMLFGENARIIVDAVTDFV